MAASVGMILDPAVKHERSGETQPQSPDEAVEEVPSSSSPPEGGHMRDEEPKEHVPTDATGAPAADPLEQNAAPVADEAPEGQQTCATSAHQTDVAPASRSKKSMPTGGRSRKAKNALGIVGPKKKKPKKKLEPGHPSLGLYVDALDRNMLWGNGRIIDINVTEEKVKITFPGFNSKWDIWTDLLSIRPHGRMACPQRGLNAKSWDGRSNLFTGEPMVESVYKDKPVGAPPSHPASSQKRGSQAPITKTADAKPIKHEPAQERELNDIKEAAPKAGDSRKRKRLVREDSPKGSSQGRSTPWADSEAVRARSSNAALADGSSAFLVRCADVWKRQLQSMTDIVISR